MFPSLVGLRETNLADEVTRVPPDDLQGNVAPMSRRQNLALVENGNSILCFAEAWIGGAGERAPGSLELRLTRLKTSRKDFLVDARFRRNGVTLKLILGVGDSLLCQMPHRNSRFEAI